MNTEDNFLHLLLGITGLAAGLATAPERTTSTTTGQAAPQT